MIRYRRSPNRKRCRPGIGGGFIIFKIVPPGTFTFTSFRETPSPREVFLRSSFLRVFPSIPSSPPPPLHFNHLSSPRLLLCVVIRHACPPCLRLKRLFPAALEQRWSRPSIKKMRWVFQSPGPFLDELDWNPFRDNQLRTR